MPGDDDETPPLGLPRADGRRRRRGSLGSTRELSSAAGSPIERWQVSRSYEFASPESTLLYVACALAVARVTDARPVMELIGSRVRVALAGEGAPSARERLSWRELTGWARKLGGRELEPREGNVR